MSCRDGLPTAHRQADEKRQVDENNYMQLVFLYYCLYVTHECFTALVTLTKRSVRGEGKGKDVKQGKAADTYVTNNSNLMYSTTDYFTDMFYSIVRGKCKH